MNIKQTKCKSCKNLTSGVIMPIDIYAETHRGRSAIGKSTDYLCESCRIKAEIELRDFVNSSKYFTECAPF